MLPRMRSGAPRLWRHNSSLVRITRWSAACVAFATGGACSVYTNDMLEPTTGITTAGNNSSGSSSDRAGSSSVAGSNSGGGKPSTDTPSEGGEGGEAGSEPTAGTAAAGKGGTDSGGTAGTESGGTAGVAGTAATAGTGGGVVVGNPNLLDDFEDQNLTIEETDKRGGVWYTFTNGTNGTMEPDPLESSANTDAPEALGGFAMHITATDFTGTDAVGSGLGVDFRDSKKVYDGSKFSGIRFWAKAGSTASAKTKRRLQITDSTTDEAGGKCNPAAAAPSEEKCNAHFGIALTFTTSWAQYSVPFEQLEQPGWGLQADALNTAALYGLQFTAPPSAVVDLWLDQVEFF
jgi:hypothetical protein